MAKRLLHEADGPVLGLADGVSFQRSPEGSVRIEVGQTVVELPPANWATAVAFVCARGDSDANFQEALAFHQRRE